ncbi:hypothetical protein WR25_21737 [Diploscapter pachys]|uniref:Phosphotyrosine protein phosphatase I domain-containing protein n=1 Tax=Diploscapter pachys TaxID=2018661 RepID=A0A2A2M0D9_9BILA|nr:hypothetical protein WR25_21737 [Diploscapter pachys]
MSTLTLSYLVQPICFSSHLLLPAPTIFPCSSGGQFPNIFRNIHSFTLYRKHKAQIAPLGGEASQKEAEPSPQGEGGNNGIQDKNEPGAGIGVGSGRDNSSMTTAKEQQRVEQPSSNLGTELGLSKTRGHNVLFVCYANTCRSAMSEAIFRDRIRKRGLDKKWTCDSAAINGYARDKSPDKRAKKMLEKNGITDYKHRARLICPEDFKIFDYILAMDKGNVRDLTNYVNEKCVAEDRHAEILLLASFDPKREVTEIADPFFEDTMRLFELIYPQLERSVEGFIQQKEPIK